MLHISWERPEIPEFDPEIHNPEKVFAFLHMLSWYTLCKMGVP